MRRILQRRREIPFEVSDHLVAVLEDVYREFGAGADIRSGPVRDASV